jgi:hypothetical protein
MFIPSFTPRGEHSLLFRRIEGEKKSSLLGDKIHTWGTTSPLVSKFAPRGKLRMGLKEVKKYLKLNWFKG